MPHRNLPAEESDALANILVVDDNPNNVLALEAMLQSMGQNVVRAQSGMDALRHLLDRDFALVLLDIQMPGLDGFETAQVIRARERTRHMPIIFLTAHSQNDAQIAVAYELGAVDFLFKPIVPLILRAKVQAFVELHHKTLEIKRQAALLRESERREHARRLIEAAQRWETKHLREEMIKERSVAETLARTVAERERAEAALQVSVAELSVRNRELADADRRKDEFLAMLAHELRNPIAPIVNAVELLRMPSTSAAGMQRALDVLDRQSGHMVRLVDDLLDLSRITAGKIQLRREPVTLASIVGHAIQICGPLLSRWQHRFDAALPERDVRLYADATRLSQVIANLLNNAAKYSPPRSAIELLAERLEDEVVIRVRDHGIGIRPDLLETVFGLFVQVDHTSERAHGGLGIGLTLVRKLVELHGGSVSAYSAGLDKGTEVTVRLPIAAELAAVSAPERASPPAPATSRASRVVVIEDNPDIGETMKAILEAWGHEATLASDGPAGVDAVLALRPDIAFIDIGLPGLDGYQVAAALRSRAPDLVTRLVALTGYGRPEDRERALAAGFDEHIVKPVTPAALRRLIEALTRAQTPDPSAASPPVAPSPAPPP